MQPDRLHAGAFYTFLLVFFESAALIFFFSGCSGVHGTRVKEDVTPMVAHEELPEPELLDVAISVFDPGEIPEDEDDRNGLSEEIRKAEACFIPVHLKYTLQRSGYWGSVWVVPDDNETADLVISGRIEYSDGERLVLYVRAVDSRNQVWLDRTYEEISLPDERRKLEPEKKDSFQDLFNAVANDLIRYRQAVSAEELRQIRRLKELRYAVSMAPEPFGRYFMQDSEGYYTLTGLPAETDPMLARIRAVRSRDEMLMDTLSGYYDGYYMQLWKPYQDWRRFRADELETIRKIKNEALTRQLLGFAAIAGAVAMGAIGDYHTARALDPLRDIMTVGGAAAVYSGYKKRQEARMNQEVIEELGESFEADATPLVVEVNGETMRLTGTAREQYEEWRRLLKEIYIKETGFTQMLPVIVGPEQGVEEESGSVEEEPDIIDQQEGAIEAGS